MRQLTVELIIDLLIFCCMKQCCVCRNIGARVHHETCKINRIAYNSLDKYRSRSELMAFYIKKVTGEVVLEKLQSTGAWVFWGKFRHTVMARLLRFSIDAGLALQPDKCWEKSLRALGHDKAFCSSKLSGM